MFIIVTDRVSASLARTASGSSSRVNTSTNGMDAPPPRSLLLAERESQEHETVKSVSHIASTRLDCSVAHRGLMQLVCQRNSLNRRDVTAQEIAELSEILTVQQNKGGARCQSLVQKQRTRGKEWQRPYIFERARSSSNSLNKPKLAGKVF
jgi:hypothetical protein